VTPSPCAFSVGFLLPHPCPNAAVGPCAKCGRAVCERHAALSGAGLLCTGCETGSDTPPLLKGALAAAGLVGGGLAVQAFASSLFQPPDVAAFEAASLLDEDGDADRFADLS